MANRTLHTPELLRQFRVFRLHYICDDCPNEWSTEMMVVAHDWCPCCDAKCEPYDYEALLEDVADEEEDEDDGYLDPDRLREDRDERLACLAECDE